MERAGLACLLSLALSSDSLAVLIREWWEAQENVAGLATGRMRTEQARARGTACQCLFGANINTERCGTGEGEALNASASQLISIPWRPDYRGPCGVLSQCSPTKVPDNPAWLLRIADEWPVNLAGDFSRLCKSSVHPSYSRHLQSFSLRYLRSFLTYMCLSVLALVLCS